MRLYIVTRRTRKWVWLRWEGFGSPSAGQRGLSRKITAKDFRAHYLPASNPMPDTYPDKYFKKHNANENPNIRLSV